MSILRLCTVILLLTPSIAQADIATNFETTTEDGNSKHTVHFDDPSCGGECYTGNLSCGPGATINLTLADVAAKDVSAAIVKERQQIVLDVGGKPFSFTTEKLTFQEMTGSWSVEAREENNAAGALVAALAKAKMMKAKMGKKVETLPVDRNVRTWAGMCGKG
jgi:hypothetical protein